MTPLPTAAPAEDVGTPLSQAWHRHDGACFWDVGECRWRCPVHPAVRLPLAHRGRTTGR